MKNQTKISENFYLEEMFVSAEHPELVEVAHGQNRENCIRLINEVLQPLRDIYGKPITIISGYRPQRLNAAVDGSKTSAHRYGLAADIICKGNRLELAKLIIENDLPYDQVIIERPKFSKSNKNEIVDCSWVHVGLSATTNRKEVKYWSGGSTYQKVKITDDCKFTK